MIRDSLKRIQIQQWSALIIILLCTMALYLRAPGNPQGRVPQDFSAYLLANQRIQNGESPYVIQDALPYKYAPGVLVPLQLLPEEPKPAWKAFGFISLVAFAFSLILGASFCTWKEVGLLLLGLALAWKGILETLDYGQLEFIFFSIAAYSTVLWRSRPLIAGALLGTLPWLKLPWLFFSIPFAVRSALKRDWGNLKRLILGYSSASLFWLVLLPVLSFGTQTSWQLTQGWLALLKSQPHDLFFSDMNQGIWLFWLHLFGNEGILQFLALTLGMMTVGILGFFILKREKQNLDYPNALSFISPWLLFGQMISPLSWRWASLLLVGLPFSLPQHRLIQHRKWRILLYGVVAFLWLLQQNPVTQLAGVHWTELHPYHVITFYWMSCLLLVL